MAQVLSRSASQLAKPNLLLSFDAFGTLFSPKDTVAHQYLQEARQHGLTGLDEAELSKHLLAALKEESKKNPNFGKATGLGATKWWANVSDLRSCTYAMTRLPLTLKPARLFKTH